MLLLALALGVGIAVAVLSGGERTRAVQSGSLPVIEHQAHQGIAEPGVRLGLSCPMREGCARL